MSSQRVYPQPPPTVNVLSTRQKAHLRRSSTKISKVLGAAPQIVDACPRTSFPFIRFVHCLTFESKGDPRVLCLGTQRSRATCSLHCKLSLPGDVRAAAAQARRMATSIASRARSSILSNAIPQIPSVPAVHADCVRRINDPRWTLIRVLPLIVAQHRALQRCHPP